MLTSGFLLCFAAPSLANDWALSPQGYGPVRIGTSPTEASKSLGAPLRYEGEGIPDHACHHLAAPTLIGNLRYMVQDGRITRISLYEGPSNVKTNKGIGLGDPARKVMEAYGAALEIEPHEYMKGNYLTFWDEKAKRGIRYETATDDPAPFLDPGDAHITRIHVGDESVNLIEGCS